MGITVGIIAEYNPFHKGHEYHIDETRKKYGEDVSVVAVMSGDFVQRGDAAVFSKTTRAEAACLCGADLVLELPLCQSLASAEHFAQGGVSILDALGNVDVLSFGSECGDASLIEETARFLLSDRFSHQLKIALEKEKNFAKARADAVRTCSAEMADLLSTPNNILAVEYAKANLQLDRKMELYTVPRTGTPHDGSGEGNEFPSAKMLRDSLKRDGSLETWDQWIPQKAMEVYRKAVEEGKGPVFRENIEQGILSRLRTLSEEDILSLPDCASGFGKRFYRAICSSASLEELEEKAKDKSVSLSRVRRTIFCAALGITEEMSTISPYVRVLSCNERGIGVLHDSSDTALRITKPASVRNMDSNTENLFDLGARAHDFYVLGYPDANRRNPGEEWINGPVICK